MNGRSFCNLCALALKAGATHLFNSLHSTDESQEGRNSFPLLRSCFIGSCHVSVSKRLSRNLRSFKKKNAWSQVIFHLVSVLQSIVCSSMLKALWWAFVDGLIDNDEKVVSAEKEYTLFRTRVQEHTLFETKLTKFDTLFMTKAAKNTPLWASHTYVAYVREHPLPEQISCSTCEEAAIVDFLFFSPLPHLSVFAIW